MSEGRRKNLSPPGSAASHTLQCPQCGHRITLKALAPPERSMCRACGTVVTWE